MRRPHIVLTVTLGGGTALLWATFRVRPASPAFFVLAVAMAIVWTYGSLVDLVALHIPYVSEVLHQVLTKTDRGPALPIVGTAVISAVGEEVFFRGALYTAIAGRHPVGWTTLAYGLVTIATGNLALVAAALGLGIVTGVQRRSTGGWWLLSSPIPSVTILALPR